MKLTLKSVLKNLKKNENNDSILDDINSLTSFVVLCSISFINPTSAIVASAIHSLLIKDKVTNIGKSIISHFKQSKVSTAIYEMVYVLIHFTSFFDILNSNFRKLLKKINFSNSDKMYLISKQIVNNRTDLIDIKLFEKYDSKISSFEMKVINDSDILNNYKYLELLYDNLITGFLNFIKQLALWDELNETQRNYLINDIKNVKKLAIKNFDNQLITLSSELNGFRTWLNRSEHKDLKDDHEKILKKLNKITSKEENSLKNIFLIPEKVKSIHYRSNIAIELFKLTEYSYDNLAKFVLNMRNISEIQYSLRLIRGISNKMGKKLLADIKIQKFIISKIPSDITNKDFISLIGLINITGSMNITFSIRIIDYCLEFELSFFIANHLKDLKKSFEAIYNIIENNYLGFILTSYFIKITPNLNNIIYTNKAIDISISIDNPKLMWDCSCDYIDNFDSTFNDCKIHSSKEGILINMYTGSPHFINYENIKILSYSGSIWPPSIDTLNFLSYLKSIMHSLEKKGIKHIIDLGCGTGIIGIYMKLLIPSIKKVTFIDSNSDAINLARYNYNLNIGDLTDAQFINFDATSIPENLISHYNKNDAMILSLPPYLPYPKSEEGKLIRNTTYSGIQGLDLLKETLINYNKLAKYIIIGNSDMTKKFVENISHNLYKIKKIPIPFRIPAILYRPLLLDWLKDNNCIYFVSNNRYKYWHNLEIFSNL